MRIYLNVFLLVLTDAFYEATAIIKCEKGVGEGVWVKKNNKQTK